jgi:hypothetical protein
VAEASKPAPSPSGIAPQPCLFWRVHGLGQRLDIFSTQVILSAVIYSICRHLALASCLRSLEKGSDIGATRLDVLAVMDGIVVIS